MVAFNNNEYRKKKKKKKKNDYWLICDYSLSCHALNMTGFEKIGHIAINLRGIFINILLWC